MHWHLPGTRQLREIAHEPTIPVLDQEDLFMQGIHTSHLVPGAKDVDALGSCVFNASTAHLPERLPAAALAKLGIGPDPVADEEFAICLYHATSDLTGDPASEWPPTDCGSSGLFVGQELKRQGVITGEKIAHGAENILSLMQDGSIIVGQPWLNAWEQPDAAGFYDGNGTVEDLLRAIQSGVAGGHETIWVGIEKIAYTAVGTIDTQHTIIRMRNSWSKSWGQGGEALVHLSTYIMLGGHCDFRQFTVA